MSRVMVRYTVKPEHVARIEELVRAVYQELHDSEPGGLRYAGCGREPSFPQRRAVCVSVRVREPWRVTVTQGRRQSNYDCP